MATKLYRGSELLLNMETVDSVSFDIKGNMFSVPIPDENDAMIMNLGGVSRKIKLIWRLVSNDVVSDVAKIGFGILDGTMFNSFRLVIEEWGLEKDCVISGISISQKAGEPNHFTVNMDIIIGEVI